MSEYVSAIIISAILAILTVLLYYYMVGWVEFSIPMGGNIEGSGIIMQPGKSVLFKKVNLVTNTNQKFDITGAMNDLASGVAAGQTLKLAGPLSLTSFSVKIPKTASSVSISGYMKIS